MNHVEEIRARINIEDLVGGYVQLKKAGRNLRGLCPFHGEKTPSFMVSPEKGIAYCFGCHQGGDIFKFIELVENVSFPEAVRILAEKANVPLPQEMPNAGNKRQKGIEINQWAVKFYENELNSNKNAKQYFLDRGLNEETIKKFKLGFAPDSFDRLKNDLLGKGFNKKELIETTIVNQRSIADQNIYDRFRNRLIFPIFDHQNNPVGFSGRIFGEGEPKYLNSPDSPTYNKSLILYALNWAKDKIKEQDQAIFVEGFMDVITAHQAGTENIIATCGTAITAQQLKLIQRFTKNLAFAFDKDAAGMEATFRAIELAQMADFNIKVIVIPDGKDPDECIKNNPDNWKNAVNNPISVMDFYFSYAFNKFDKTNMEGKKKILDFLLPIIRIYKTDMEKGEYLNRLAVELKTDVRLLWGDLKKAVPQKKYSTDAQNDKAPENSEQKRRIFSREEFLLGFICNYPETYEDVSQNLIDTIPLNPNTERFYNTLKKVYTLGSSLDMSRFREELSEEEKKQIDIYTLLIDEFYPEFSDDSVKKEVDKLVKEINRQNLYNIQKDYEIKIRRSEDSEEKKGLLNKYNEILKLTVKL